MVISSLAFLVYHAKTTYDFGLSFLYSSALSAGGIFYVMFTWQIENTLKFIAHCDTFIEQSKWQKLNHFYYF